MSALELRLESLVAELKAKSDLDSEINTLKQQIVAAELDVSTLKESASEYIALILSEQSIKVVGLENIAIENQKLLSEAANESIKNKDELDMYKLQLSELTKKLEISNEKMLKIEEKEKCNVEILNQKHELLSKLQREKEDGDSRRDRMIEQLQLSVVDIETQSKLKINQLEDDLTSRVVEDASIRERYHQLSSKCDELVRQSGIYVKERDEARTAAQDSEHLFHIEIDKLRIELQQSRQHVETIHEELIFLKESLSASQSELNLMTQRFQAAEADLKNAQNKISKSEQTEFSVLELTEQLSAANNKLSKIDEKKKRDLENLKKQNELISKIQREKEDSERGLQQVLQELRSELSLCKTENQKHVAAYAELETIMELKNLELARLLNANANISILSTETVVDSLCEKCGRLQSDLDAVVSDWGNKVFYFEFIYK